MSGCTCHHYGTWEYGQCDYCTSEICDECEQHQDYCECDETDQEEEEIDGI